MRAGEVSEVSQDYLKAIWSAREWGGEPVTATELAKRFGTTKANVTDVLKRLDELGLVVRVPYRPPELTAEGEKIALSMVRRHRLIETFLVESLGYSWDEVHDEAESLEHAASDLLIERIDDFLGHPTADPHGDPIPEADGTVVSHDSSPMLAGAAPGSYRVLRVSDADPEVLSQLAELGVRPGARIEVAGATADSGDSRGRHADADAAAAARPPLILATVDGRRRDIPAEAAAAVHLSRGVGTSTQ
ncbi:DtxR family iron (metal) dependent repressor [Brevibacterium sanguinis]|uniref:Manganese transport regulator n=2 Tax=Brevibacterium TaxID=1696 RepID=A0A366IIC8_9MICO|nr:MULTISPECIES: metal-dependent transcriptional regulator [Brevibacterium]RBP62253.1 DtxR family iron (metal) dependent repressor [Brevibacterium sanguinis]RBP70615.1 DtxR family iron (metal) dependent repressor [Brevibacterium celere]